MSDKHGAHQTDEAYVVSLCEDFCKSPSAPVGYMISQKLDLSTMVCSTVNGCGTPVLNMSSRVCSVAGNEAGVGGGVVSGVNLGMCKPVDGYAEKVRAEGQCILRHDTIMEMNTAGPDGPGNIKGRIVYLSKQASPSYSDKRGGKASQKKATKRKKIETRKLRNGCEVDIYETDGRGSGYSFNKSTGRAEIVLGDNKDYVSEANEIRHAQMDANDGVMDNDQHDDKGNRLRYLEAEAESDKGSIEAIDEKHNHCNNTWNFYTGLFGVCWEYKGKTNSAQLRRFYSRRRKAMLEADDKIKKGDIAGARKIANANPDAKSYIEKAIAYETGSP